MNINWPGENVLLKLWETLAEKGMGKLLTPWQLKREGHAHAEIRRHEMLTLAQAELDIADLQSGRKRYLDGKLVALGKADGRVEENAITCDLGRVEPALDLPSLSRTATQTREFVNARSEINAARAIIFLPRRLSKIIATRFLTNRLMMIGFSPGSITQARCLTKIFSDFGARCSPVN